MGLLTDDPLQRPAKPGKFVRLYRSLDADDQERIRRWDADPQVTLMAVYGELSKHFEISYAAMCRGLTELRENQWEA